MILEYLKKTYHNSIASFYQLVEEKLEKEQKMFIVTANPEVLMIGAQNEQLDTILRDDTVTIVPDGIGVVKAMHQVGIPCNERITGVELAIHLLTSANRFKKSVFFYGAKPEVIEALMEKVKQDYPNLVIAGYQDGYNNKGDAVFETIIAAKPDIIFVALGVPAQELLIAKHIDQFQKGIFIGVGGSFDVLSGLKARAPKIFIKLNLEWLYRISKEPKRFGRFYRSNVKFFSTIKKENKKP